MLSLKLCYNIYSCLKFGYFLNMQLRYLLHISKTPINFCVLYQFFSSKNICRRSRTSTKNIWDTSAVRRNKNICPSLVVTMCPLCNIKETFTFAIIVLEIILFSKKQLSLWFIPYRHVNDCNTQIWSYSIKTNI